VLAEVNQTQGGCAAKGASAAPREKPVSRGAPSCAQGPTLGFSVSPRDPRFSPVSLRRLLPRSLLVDATSVSNTIETVYLPTASGPVPVVALIHGEPFAVYADHLPPQAAQRRPSTIVQYLP
jgi:hypothetical protein